MKEILFENVCKSYGKTQVVHDLNLTINEGERLILLGPSGCGKSTILRMIAGLEDITSGKLCFDGECMNDVSSGDRNVAMVFQNYALFPHMTVEENITYGLRVHKLEKSEISKRLNNAISILKLNGLEDRKPKNLSGGQRQRVALARAIVKRSDLLLLDEPLSNLDAQLRGHARKELVKIHQMYRQTFIYVTHDQVEAMTVGDRIALLHKGDLQMVDTPHNVYNRPANVFTAKFIGSPPMNVIEASIHENKLLIGRQGINLPRAWLDLASSTQTDALYLGIRPENITFARSSEDQSLVGTVKYVEDYGNRKGVYFEVEDNEMIAIMDDSIFSENDKIAISIDFNSIHLFDRESNANIGYPEELTQ